MQTITGQNVVRGDWLSQVAQISLGKLNEPVVVQAVDEEHHGVVLGKDLDGPPMKNFDGSVRLYEPTRFMKLFLG